MVNREDSTSKNIGSFPDQDQFFCYGCSHSIAGEHFPGKPSGERPCHFCFRNPKAGFFVDTWYDGSKPVWIPMDCYHSLDMSYQIAQWETDLKDRIESEKQARIKYQDLVYTLCDYVDKLTKSDSSIGTGCTVEDVLARLKNYVKDLERQLRRSL